MVILSDYGYHSVTLAGTLDHFLVSAEAAVAIKIGEQFISESLDG